MKPVGLVVLLVVVLGVGALLYVNFNRTTEVDPGCPGHWHASFDVVVDGRDVPFAHPSFSNPEGSHDSHIHADDGVLHYHPTPAGCVELEDMMAVLDVEVDDGAIVLGAKHGALAGSYGPGGDDVVRILHKPWGGAWAEVSWETIQKAQLGNGDKMLLYHGPESGLAAARDAVRDLPPQYAPAEASSTSASTSAAP